ncbi:MAG: helix-turn-helix transcriptional regulator [Dehalococcoidia bacterium]|nr:helix-turn-helix transcriptional regulator [Dehalococcoidia bacterium]
MTSHTPRLPDAPATSLTPRQREVLALVARERTNFEIATLLGITLEGVKYHISEILWRLELGSREEAAAWWRAQQRPAGRLRRRLQALFALPLLKVAAGSAAVTSLAGGAFVVAAIAGGGPASPEVPAAPSAPTAPDETPCTPLSASLPATVTLATVDPGGYTVSLEAFATPTGLCLAWRDSRLPGSWGAAGPVRQPAAIAGFGTSRPTVLHGVLPATATRARLNLNDGTTRELAVVPPPASLGTDLRFYLTTAARYEDVRGVDVFDAAGALIDSASLYVGPPPPSRPPAYADFTFAGSGAGGAGSGFFRVADAAATYRFRVAHEGPGRVDLLLWCQTGVVPLRWETGPDAAGAGVVLADVPAGAFSCAWNAQSSGGDFTVDSEE